MINAMKALAVVLYISANIWAVIAFEAAEAQRPSMAGIASSLAALAGALVTAMW
jgi:hypothetical protein